MATCFLHVIFFGVYLNLVFKLVFKIWLIKQEHKFDSFNQFTACWGYKVYSPVFKRGLVSIGTTGNSEHKVLSA